MSDEWRRSEAPRYRAYEPPTSGIFDADEECVCLRINRKWTPFLTGVIDILTNHALWISEDEEYAPEQIRMLIGALMGEGNEMTCPPPIEDFKFEDGVLSMLKDGEWIPIDGSERIVTSVNAIAGGFEVEQGGAFTEENPECADPCEKFPDTPVYDQEGALRACAIADGVVDWTMERYQDLLDQAEVISGAADVVQSALKLVFPPSYILFAPMVEVVKNALDLGIASSRAFDTVEFREEFKEALYCFIRDHGDTLNAEDWEVFREDWFDPHAPPLISEYFETFDPAGIEDQAHKQSYNEDGECTSFECSDCLGEVDFETTGGYTVTAGEREAGVGNPSFGAHESVTGSDDEAGFTVTVTVVIDLGESITVGEIEYDYKATASVSPTADRNMQQFVRGSNDLSSWTNLVSITSGDSQPQGEWHTRLRTWSPADYRYIELRLFAGWGSWGDGDNTGTITLDNLCVK